MVHERGVFGATLRRRRLAAGLSLNDLAARLHYSKGYLSKIENGSKEPGPDLARRCDNALNAEGALIRLIRVEPEPVTDPDDGLTDVGDWELGLAMDGSSEVRLVRRREVLLGGAVSLLGVTAAGPATAAVAGQRATADGYTALLAEARALGQIRPPALVLPTLIVHLHTLVTLARAAPEPARPRLLLLASRFAEYIGWMVQESGDDRAMAWWTQRAVEYAQAGGDLELTAYAYVRHANAALYRDDPATTVELAGQAFDRSADTAFRVRGLARQRQAQGHALIGRRDDCLRALEQARLLLDAAATAGTAAAERPVLGTATVADPSDLALGWCLHDLGRPEEAVPVLHRHLAQVPVTAHRARARVGARLALAQAAAGDPAAACAIARTVLDDALPVDSATVRHDLRHLGRSLNRWRTDPDVQQLSPRLAEALRSPVLRGRHS